jgi:hypothetical protein
VEEIKLRVSDEPNIRNEEGKYYDSCEKPA